MIFNNLKISLNLSTKILNNCIRACKCESLYLNARRSYTTITFQEDENGKNNLNKKVDIKIQKNMFQNFDQTSVKVKKVSSIKAEILKIIGLNRSKFEKLRKEQLGAYPGAYRKSDEFNNEVIELFLSWHVDEKSIIDLYVSCPLLWQMSDQQVITTMKVLSKFLYSTKQSFDLLKKCPYLLIDPELLLHLQRVLGEIKSLGIEQKKAQLITLNNPQIIETPLKTIKNNFNKILEYFVKSEALLITSKCPNILSDDWPINEFKLQYAFHEMHLTTKIIAQSKFFSHTIEDILIRHKLLERLGYYTKPNLKNLVDSGDNPRQKEIFQVNDHDFVKYTAKISRQEFDAFKESIRNEIREGKVDLKRFFVDGNGEVMKNADGEDEDEGSDDDDGEEDDDEDGDDRIIVAETNTKGSI